MRHRSASSALFRLGHAACLSAVVVCALSGRSALAVSGSWDVDADGNWSTTSNWLGGVMASGSDFTATFSNDITANRTVTLDGGRTLSAIVFGDANPSSAASWILTGSSVTLQGPTTGNATITVGNLGTNATATLSAALAVTNNGAVFVKDGPGTLVLGVNNTIAGKTSVLAGTLQVSANGQLGATPATFTADQLTLDGGTLRTSASFAMGANRGITIGSSGGTLNINGGAMSYAGRFTGLGNTVTTAGVAGLTLTNTTGVASDVNWDVTGPATRLFFTNQDALGSGTVTIRNSVRLTYTGGSALTTGNLINVDSGGGVTARGAALVLSNAVLPSSGSILMNTDDSAQSSRSLTITSGGVLTGDLTVETRQTGTNTIGDVFLDGVFSGTGGFVKSGTGNSGRLILRGTNTYTGNTTISTGTLRLGNSGTTVGSIGSSAAISIATGATFDVSGNTAFSLGTGQVLSGSGTILGDFAFGSGSKLAYDFSTGVPLTATGTASFQVGSNFGADDIVGLSSSTPEGTYTLIAGTVDVSNLQNVGIGSAYDLGGGKAAYFQSGSLQLVVVPEPTIVFSSVAGLATLVIMRTQRRVRDRHTPSS